MPTKASIRQNNYDKDHTVKYTIKLNTTTDKDIIEMIDTLSQTTGSKQGAIKQLIRSSNCTNNCTQK